jgi:sugar phosphate isomerase/epimerase
MSAAAYRALDRWVLWSGTVGFESRIAERVEAALAIGADRFSLGITDIAREAEHGLALDDVAHQINDAGLSVVLDPVLNWYSDPVPDAPLPFAVASVEDNLRVSEVLPVTSFNAIANLDAFAGLTEPEVISKDCLVESFAQLCDHAAEVGADVHLEFVPDSAVPDITVATEVVVAADRVNGGIMFDSWHFYAGNPDFDALLAVPHGLIVAVQLNDAKAEISRPYIADSLNRLLPGEGSFDLDRVIRALVSVEGLRHVGAEIFNEEFSEQGAVVAASVSTDRVRSMVETVVSVSF